MPQKNIFGDDPLDRSGAAPPNIFGDFPAPKSPATATGNNKQPPVGQTIYQPPNRSDQIKELLSTIMGAQGPIGGLAGQVLTQGMQGFKEGVRPLISGGAAGLVGGAYPPVAFLSAPLTYTAVDTALQYVTNPERSLEEKASAAGRDAIINEVGGLAIRGGQSFIKNLKRPAPQTGSIHNLDPTYSQLRKMETGQNAPVTKFIEDVFASAQKAAAIDKSAELALGEGYRLAYDMSNIPIGGGQRTIGRTLDEIKNPHLMKDFVKSEVDAQLQASKKASNAQADNAILISKMNPQQLANGQVIEGPVPLNSTIMKAKEYVDVTHKMNPLLPLQGVPPDNPMYSLSQSILANTNAKFDPAGNLISHDPISFKDAWTFKQLADFHGYGKAAKMAAGGIVPPVNPFGTIRNFKDFSKSINADIDAGLSHWANDPNGIAKDAWNQAKSIVAERQLIYNTKGSALKKIVDNSLTDLPTLNKLIDNEADLQKALNAGGVRFPSRGFTSSNLREDLQAYQMGRMLRNATDKTGTRLEYDKFINQLTDPDMQPSLRKLYSAQDLANIQQFAKDFGITQEKSITYPIAKKIWAVHGGLAVASSLLMGSMTHSAGMALGAGGVYLSGNLIGRILTSKAAARTFIDMIGGKPAGKSAQTVSRLIMGALQGSTIGLMGEDGKIQPAVVDKNQLKPVDPDEQ